MEKICWFDHISDDILLHILYFVPQKDWRHTSKVCARFRNVCQDREIFRYTNLSCAYGMSGKDLENYLRAGSRYIETLNLNHCYWFSSTTLAVHVSRCKNIQHLYLLDCKLTAKALTKILCSIECLKSIVVSVLDLLEFSRLINGNNDVQGALRHLRHFGLHIREDGNDDKAPSLQLHLSQQTTVIEYCPNLETFCVIGTPGPSRRLSKRLIQPLIVKTEHLKHLRTMSINSTGNDTSILYFFGVLVKAFEQTGNFFRNLSMPGLDYKNAPRPYFFNQTLKDSLPTLVNLDLSKSHIDNLQSTIHFENAPCLKDLNLADIQTQSQCHGLLTSASTCSNLVSLNLKGGATSGCRLWGQEELDGLDLVLRNCRNLQHLNISGIHVHNTGSDKSLIDVLTKNDISAFKSLALSVCCLVKIEDRKEKSNQGFISKGIGKRQRVSRQQQPSAGPGEDSANTVQTELSHLQKACPRLTSLELIEAGHTSGHELAIHRGYFDWCNNSSLFRENDLSPISSMTNLRYLQLTGLPGVRSGRFLQQIGENCVHLEILLLANIGLRSQIQGLYDSLTYFKNLKDLRVEQPWMKLNERFFQSCLGCDRLQRLVIISRCSRVEPKPLENFVAKGNQDITAHFSSQRYRARPGCTDVQAGLALYWWQNLLLLVIRLRWASQLYLIQLFTETPLKVCDRLQSALQKRYGDMRPGFHAVLENLLHESFQSVLAATPLVHLDQITNLSSKVCSQSLFTLPGE